MAVEFSKEWASTKHRYIYTHHVPRTNKDYAGITVESLRSPSGTDSWHHRMVISTHRGSRGFYYKEEMKIARITHIFLIFSIIRLKGQRSS
jgi:hypothetical protein